MKLTVKLKPLRQTCNIVYTDRETGKNVTCNPEGEPRPAKWRSRTGSRVCEECWPTVLDHFSGTYGAMATAAALRVYRRC